MQNQITLATLGQATAQEVFDQVARHLLTQGEQSMVDGDTCSYRGDDGLMCAAGCLIADEEYRDDFEETTWGALVYAKLVPPDHQGLIQRLQNTHDACEPCDWPEILTEMAIELGLSPAVIKEFQP